jgi:Tol biopolymer transport system component
MRKFIVLPLLVLLAACTEQTAVGPDGDPGFVAAKGGIKGPPKEEPPEPPDADPAIAFNTYGRKTGYCLRVMNADGSNDTRLICGSGVLSPSWSPDGGSLAFVKRWGDIAVPGEYELWRMDVTLDSHGVPVWSDPTPLPLATCAGQPAWSPVEVDGVHVIAYNEASYSSNCRNNRLSYVTSNGDTKGTLYEADPGVYVSFPAWSGDATKIAFVESEFLDGQNVWRINILHLPITASPTVETVFDGGDQFWEIWDLDWSRGGDCLAFSAFSAGSAMKKRSKQHVYTLCEPDLPTQIIEGGSGVTWSPDGGSLLVKRSGGDLVRVDLTNYTTETLRRGGFHPDWRRNPPPAPVP